MRNNIVDNHLKKRSLCDDNDTFNWRSSTCAIDNRMMITIGRFAYHFGVYYCYCSVVGHRTRMSADMNNVFIPILIIAFEINWRCVYWARRTLFMNRSFFVIFSLNKCLKYILLSLIKTKPYRVEVNNLPSSRFYFKI